MLLHHPFYLTKNSASSSIILVQAMKLNVLQAANLDIARTL